MCACACVQECASLHVIPSMSVPMHDFNSFWIQCWCWKCCSRKFNFFPFKNAGKRQLDKPCRCLRRPNFFSSLSFSQRRNKTWPANVPPVCPCVFCAAGQEVLTQLTLRIILKMKTLILLEALQSTNALQCVIIFGSNPFPLDRNLVTLYLYLCDSLEMFLPSLQIYKRVQSEKKKVRFAPSIY